MLRNSDSAIGQADQSDRIYQAVIAARSEGAALSALRAKSAMGYDYNLTYQNSNPNRPISLFHYAVEHNYQELLTVLLRSIEDNIPRLAGEILQACADLERQGDTANKLARFTLVAQVPVDEDNNTLLHLAVKSNQENLIRLLIEAGFNPYKPNKQQESPLFLTVYKGGSTLAKKLLQSPHHQFEPWYNQANASGLTPLHVAITQGHVAYANWYCEHVKDQDAELFVNTELHYGYSELMYAAAFCIHDRANQPYVQEDPVSRENRVLLFSAVLKYANNEDLESTAGNGDNIVELLARYRTQHADLWVIIKEKFSEFCDNGGSELLKMDGQLPSPVSAPKVVMPQMLGSLPGMSDDPTAMMSAEDRDALAVVFGCEEAHPDQTAAISAWLQQEGLAYDELYRAIQHISDRDELLVGEVDVIYRLLAAEDKLPDDEIKAALFMLLISGILKFERDDVLGLISANQQVCIYLQPKIAVKLTQVVIDYLAQSVNDKNEKLKCITLELLNLLMNTSTQVTKYLFETSLTTNNAPVMEVVLSQITRYTGISYAEKKKLFSIDDVLAYASSIRLTSDAEVKAKQQGLVKSILHHPHFVQQVHDCDCSGGLTRIHQALKDQNFYRFFMLCDVVPIYDVVDAKDRNMLCFALEYNINYRDQSLYQNLLDAEEFPLMLKHKDTQGRIVLHYLADGYPGEKYQDFLEDLQKKTVEKDIDLRAVAAIEDNKGNSAVAAFQEKLAEVIKKYNQSNNVKQFMSASRAVNMALSWLTESADFTSLLSTYIDILLHKKLDDKTSTEILGFLESYLGDTEAGVYSLRLKDLPLYWYVSLAYSNTTDQLAKLRYCKVMKWCEKNGAKPSHPVDGDMLINLAIDKGDALLARRCLTTDLVDLADGLVKLKIIDWYLYQDATFKKTELGVVKLLSQSIDIQIRRSKIIELANDGNFVAANRCFDLLSKDEQGRLCVSVTSTADEPGVVMLEHIVMARKQSLTFESSSSKSRKKSNSPNRAAEKASLDLVRKLCSSKKLPAALAVSIIENNDKALVEYCDFNPLFIDNFIERLSVGGMAGLLDADSVVLNQIIKDRGLLFIAIENDNQAIVKWLLDHDVKLKDTLNSDGKKPHELVDEKNHPDIRSRLKPPKTKIERRDEKPPAVDLAALPSTSIGAPAEHKKPNASKKTPGLPPMESFIGEPVEGVAYSLGKVDDIQLYLQVAFINAVRALRLVNEAGQQVHRSVEYEKVGKKYRLTFESGQHIKIHSDFTQWLASIPTYEPVESGSGALTRGKPLAVASIEERAHAGEEGPVAEASPPFSSGGRASSASDVSSSSGHGTLSSVGSSLFEINGEYFPDTNWQAGLPELDGIWLDFPDNARLDTGILYDDDTLWIKLIKVDNVVTFSIITNVGRAAVRPSAIQYQIVTPGDRSKLALKIMLKDTPHYVHVPIDRQQWKLPAPLSAAAQPFAPARPAVSMPCVFQQAPSATPLPDASLFMQQQFMAQAQAQAQAQRAAYAAMASASGYTPAQHGSVLAYPQAYGPAMFPVQRGFPPEGFMPAQGGPMPRAQPR